MRHRLNSKKEEHEKALEKAASLSKPNNKASCLVIMKAPPPNMSSSFVVMSTATANELTPGKDMTSIVKKKITNVSGKLRLKEQEL